MANSLGEKRNRSTTNRNQSPTNCGDTFSSWLGGHSGLPCHPLAKSAPQPPCSLKVYLRCPNCAGELQAFLLTVSDSFWHTA